MLNTDFEHDNQDIQKEDVPEQVTSNDDVENSDVVNVSSNPESQPSQPESQKVFSQAIHLGGSKFSTWRNNQAQNNALVKKEVDGTEDMGTALPKSTEHVDNENVSSDSILNANLEQEKIDKDEEDLNNPAPTIPSTLPTPVVEQSKDASISSMIERKDVFDEERETSYAPVAATLNASSESVKKNGVPFRKSKLAYVIGGIAIVGAAFALFSALETPDEQKNVNQTIETVTESQHGLKKSEVEIDATIASDVRIGEPVNKAASQEVIHVADDKNSTNDTSSKVEVSRSENQEAQEITITIKSPQKTQQVQDGKKVPPKQSDVGKVGSQKQFTQQNTNRNQQSYPRVNNLNSKIDPYYDAQNYVPSQQQGYPAQSVQQQAQTYPVQALTAQTQNVQNQPEQSSSGRDMKINRRYVEELKKTATLADEFEPIEQE